MNYLVTGADTGVGKTFITSGLIRFARSKEILADYDYRDIARDLGLSVIVVAANRVGVLNQARLRLNRSRRPD